MQDNQIAIRTKNLGKCYHIYAKPFDRLKQIASVNKKKYYREFWALQDVSFEVRKGESIGIIGRNGSGKSTLLQMLCKTLTPSIGEIEVFGRINALLELGAGFNPEFTGRENVYLNGSILGFNNRDINQRFKDILEFSEIGEYINQPVKTYSSGMFVRLAFAVQACTDPDILIVDEALSVGDIFFQQKCAARIQKLREQGTTLIFVSHDMSLVRDLCEKSLYLKNGEVIYQGMSKEAINKYLGDTAEIKSSSDSEINDDIKCQSIQNLNPIETFKHSAIWVSENSTSKKQAKLIAISVFDENNIATLQTQMTSKLKFQILYQSFTDQPLHVTLLLRNRYNHLIHCSGSYTHDIKLPYLKKGELSIYEIELECLIEAGKYTFSVSLGLASTIPNQGQTVDESPWLGPITITWDYYSKKAPWYGMFGIPTRSRFISLNSDMNMLHTPRIQTHFQK
ncbi:MAG: ABC transporter ATP-binding protein [Gammaproteobacteria bacterium]